MTQTQTNVNLGTRYEDDLTGFTGIATAHCEYLNGTNIVRLENETNDRWVEVDRLVMPGPPPTAP